MYFELNDQESSSFLTMSRFTSVDGPQSLVRFTDSMATSAAALGRFDKRVGIFRSYWMYASEVEEVLDQVSGSGPYGLSTIREVSERWAVSDDWGDLKRLWVLNIPTGKTVDGYCGFAKFQPKISERTQARTGLKTSNSYRGGSMQFLLGLTQEQRRWIRGPIPTLALSKRKLRKHGVA